MKISHNWLQTYFDEKIPAPLKLAELITFHSFEIEGVEKVGNDSVIDVKVLPDRAHNCLCHKGIADEIAVMTKQALKSRAAKAVETDRETKPDIKIEDKVFCARYMGRCVEIDPIKASPPWLKNFLTALGQRSIAPMVDAANLVMFDIGQPMHVFDADKVKGAITVRAAKQGEKITLLDGQEISLTPDDFLIADDEGPLGVAGVKGGKRAEVTPSTKRLIIESAHFNPIAVRRTATRLDIRSEASKRFENEITPELAPLAMNNVSALIKEICPEARFGPIIDVYLVKAVQTVIDFDPAYADQRLGMKVPRDEAKDILTRLGIAILEKDDRWSLTIPFERLDLRIPEDIVEEIGRIYGYDHIKGVLPEKIADPLVLAMFYLMEHIRSILISAGFSEVSLYTLVPKGEIEIAKPLARDKAFARKNLTDGLLVCLEKNVQNADLLGLEEIKIFEIGHIFSREGESVMLGLGAAQVKKAKGVSSEKVISATVSLLGNELRTPISKHKITADGLHTVTELNLDEIVKEFKPGVSYGDFNFEPASNNRYAKISPFPFITRDIAILVPEATEVRVVWESVLKGIKKAGALELLVRHSFFDMFKKGNETSYAFRLVFQSMDRTLTDVEANKIMERINEEIEMEKWQVR
ncbi:MAG: phenylalanyl-tRNA synthetase beta chain [Candidatus Parcubacteria bacterium]|jgi:phenylalanyl-tRNA synthetase beta chain|nr:phenylalanyl-tRNA synthetase beta chain [Candidatus Parcubacteria bacterium]